MQSIEAVLRWRTPAANSGVPPRQVTRCPVVRLGWEPGLWSWRVPFQEIVLVPSASQLGAPDELVFRTGQVFVLRTGRAHATSYGPGRNGEDMESGSRSGARPRVHGGGCRLVVTLEVGLEVGWGMTVSRAPGAVQGGTPP